MLIWCNWAIRSLNFRHIQLVIWVNCETLDQQHTDTKVGWDSSPIMVYLCLPLTIWIFVKRPYLLAGPVHVGIWILYESSRTRTTTIFALQYTASLSHPPSFSATFWWPPARLEMLGYQIRWHNVVNLQKNISSASMEMGGTKPCLKLQLDRFVTLALPQWQSPNSPIQGRYSWVCWWYLRCSNPVDANIWMVWKITQKHAWSGYSFDIFGVFLNVVHLHIWTAAKRHPTVSTWMRIPVNFAGSMN